MPQARDIFPPFDAGPDIWGPIGFDFAPWLTTGADAAVTVTSATLTCDVVSGDDPTPQDRVRGDPWIVDSTCRAVEVRQLFGSFLDGVTYRLTCQAVFSDGIEREPLWIHCPAKAPN